MSTLCLKFQRRTDLSVQTRLLIGYQVTHQNSWGCVIRLACKYNVSRPFIYQSASIFQSLSEYFFCSEPDSSKNVSVDSGLRYLLSLRMEDRCSLSGISTLLSRQSFPNSSVGYISETLQSIGTRIGNRVPVLNTEDSITFLSICSDSDNS